MLDNIDLKNVLILDIETVPQYAAFDDLPYVWKDLWIHKVKNLLRDDITAGDLYHRAGFYAEFGKIICISVGIFAGENSDTTLRMKSFYGDDEKILLGELCDTLNKSYNKEENSLCAHNGREFDFPFISRRCVINNVCMPGLLNNSGKKPWEIRLLDTMDMWKFGDFKSYTSLNLLAAVFGINSPKDDIDGSQVWSTYWIDNDLERIKTYCQKDVVTVAQLLLRFKGMELLKEENVVYTN
ncbi:MAG: ribonuclease H-like domain-containing protein [Bacteroidota bacterium]|nr:ribonuclease H-like domain-containing protein [Bacteroidota bacterium]